MANSNIAFTEEQIRDTQGLVFSGYAAMSYCSFYLLQIKDVLKVNPGLSALQIESRRARKNTDALNLAITATGFQTLGINIDSFEQAFQDGMLKPNRSVILGDQIYDDSNNKLKKSVQEKVIWGNPANPVHLLLMLYSTDEKTHEKRQKEEESSFKQSGLILVKDRLDTTNLDEIGRFEKEHFGFADGVYNLIVAGFPSNSGKAASNNPQVPQVIETGEFILGYPNGYDGKVTKVPGEENCRDEKKFGFNGTYLVFRQLEQDIKGFWSFINAEAKRQGIKPDYLAAKMVGRWKNGAVVSPEDKSEPKTVNNDFDFRDDYDGQGCPYGSHIHRTNPRGQGLGVEQVLENGQLTDASVKTSLKVANRHRILRRGRSYGNFLENPVKDDDSRERSLFFICLNANIERQFEFVQHTLTTLNLMDCTKRTIL